MKRKHLLVFLIILSSVLQFKNYILRYETDHINQSKFAANFIDGKGISLTVIDPNDWSLPKYQVVGDWAPGIAIVLGVSLKLFDSHITALNFLAGIFIALIFISLGLSFRNANKRILLSVFIVLSISYAPFRYLHVSGLASLSFLLLGLFLVQYWLECDARNKVLPFYYFLFLGLILFIPSFFRFSYYPTGFVLITAYICMKWFLKQKISFKNVAITSLSLCVFTGIQLLYQRSINTLNFMENREEIVKESLLYINNLTLFDPIVLNTFFSTGVWTNKIWTDNLPNYYTALTHIFSLFIFCIICYSAYIFWKDKDRKNHIDIPIYLLTFTSFSVILFLVALSLYYPSWSGETRTFVTVTRYFSMFSLIIILYISITFDRNIILKGFFASFVLFNLAVYINSARVYGVGDLKKQISITIPGRLDFHNEIEKYLSKDKQNILISDALDDINAISISHPEVSIGILEEHLHQAESEDIYISKPTQMLVFAHWADHQKTETRLKNTFGSENVRKIDRNGNEIAVWKVQLQPNK